MIGEAFGSIQFPVLPLVKRVAVNGEESGDTAQKIQMFRRNPLLFTPKDFDYSPYFDIIKYPFIDFHTHSDQRLLPWSRTGSLNEDESHLYMEPEMSEPDALTESASTEDVAVDEADKAS